MIVNHIKPKEQTIKLKQMKCGQLGTINGYLVLRTAFGLIFLNDCSGYDEKAIEVSPYINQQDVTLLSSDEIVELRNK